jgi:hypothetical protein
MAGECVACPEGGDCDGSDQMSCRDGFYAFESTPSTTICHECPTVSELNPNPKP